jgi:hypothetical protein
LGRSGSGGEHGSTLASSVVAARTSDQYSPAFLHFTEKRQFEAEQLFHRTAEPS